MPAAKEWAAIRTKSRCEKVVAEWLRERGVPSFLPLVSKRRVYGGRIRISRLPLFPGYLFYDMAALERTRVFDSRRVAQVLPSDDPERLRRELDNLARALAVDDSARAVERYEPGTPVEVVAGPLRGLTGELVRSGAKSTLIVRVQFLSLAAELAIDEAFLKTL